MDFSFAEINWIAVLVASLVYFFVGTLWYSPLLFANSWMQLTGKTRDDLNANPFYFIASFFLCLIGSTALACLFQIAGVTGFVPGLLAGVMAGLAVASAMAVDFLHSGQSIQLYLITSGYHFVSFTLAGLILAIWR